MTLKKLDCIGKLFIIDFLLFYKNSIIVGAQGHLKKPKINI